MLLSLNHKILIMRSFLPPLLLVAFLAFVGTALWNMTPAPTPGNTVTASTTPLALGGDFTLQDTTNTPVASASFKGTYALVYFGYTYCPDICPADLLIFGDILKKLGSDADQLKTIFISVDPERDTPEHLATYMQNYDPRIIALTGTPEQVETAKKAYKVYSAKATPDGSSSDYLVDHSTFLYLMDRDGTYIAHFQHGTTAETIASVIITRLAAEHLTPKR